VTSIVFSTTHEWSFHVPTDLTWTEVCDALQRAGRPDLLATLRDVHPADERRVHPDDVYASVEEWLSAVARA
jgi:2-iminoacetate synthase ThiH